MRVLLQRVAQAEVVVDDAVVGSIGRGLLALVGIGPGDNTATVDRMADRVVGLRVFPDATGKTQSNINDIGGGILVVSQFTLYADTQRGRRPSYLGAAAPALAAPLVERLIAACAERLGRPVACGRFGADMRVSLINDGPFTLWLDSEA
jgi:D-aminoacyl-tRNA deacylase